tara:strand:- start:536 stop:736 length:201 start_codon:yes stop_codon:yes gene_type:complete
MVCQELNYFRLLLHYYLVRHLLHHHLWLLDKVSYQILVLSLFSYHQHLRQIKRLRLLLQLRDILVL